LRSCSAFSQSAQPHLRCPHRSSPPAEITFFTDDSDDNALAETINGLSRAEVIHRRGPWWNYEAVEFATLAWVDWFNYRRLLEPIGNIPPTEAEERDYAMRDAQRLAA
jgi:hypothetical protein